MLKHLKYTELSRFRPGTAEYFNFHHNITKKKRILRSSFETWYSEFNKYLAISPSEVKNAKVLELGSGGGFIKEIVPNIITSDVFPHIADLQIDAQKLPFGDGEIGAIFMSSVLHHIPNVKLFFDECHRCLMPKGFVFIIEPSHSLFARVFYPNFHHEPYNPTQDSWSFLQSNRMQDTNQALSYIIFKRDRDKFETAFPNLKIEKFWHCQWLSYLLSGGVNYRQISPKALDGFILWLDKAFQVFNPIFSLSWGIVIKKI